MLTPATLPRFQEALAESGLDGWLLFDFRGVNPIVGRLVGLEGMVTRRIFAWIPREGAPVAVTHAIEQGPWRRWPAEWGREVYSSWRELEALLPRLVRGKRVAMEYSPGDAVPYVDRVPAGVLELVRAAGADVVTSGDLVSRFAAAWSEEELAAHRRAAEAIAEIAQEGMRMAGARARDGRPMQEHELQRWIRERFAERGLLTDDDHGPIVAVDGNAANPHYEPSASRPVPITSGCMLLVDLWAHEPGGAWADQTWMAAVGEPTPRQREVWEAVRDARDAALTLLRERVSAGEWPRGADADDAARRVIEQRGFGERFIHRTGHSIDASGLHGSGPHIDNHETREERRLVPGVGFSVEPGVYFPGEIGVRSEVNAWIGDGEVLVTPTAYQRELLVV